MGCMRPAAWAALPVGIALLLGVVPQQARAGVCERTGLLPGCVEKFDIKRNSLRARDIKVESQAYFDLVLGPAVPVGTGNKTYSKVSLTPPVDGWLVINGSANIFTDRNTVDTKPKATISCGLYIGRRFSTSKLITASLFRGSASGSVESIVSIASSDTVRVDGERPRKVFLACQRLSGDEIRISSPALTVVFHPVRY